MKIPFVDLHAQYASIKADIDAAMQRVVDRTAFIGGEDLKKFEAEFAVFCTAKVCVGCGNGTDALYLALRALDVGRGDEVITVSHTFIATTEAISQTGAKPVFVDIREDTMLMDPDKIEAAITPRTKAIVAVHLYGQPCEMDRIMEIARRHGLKVVEDAAQAHGARWKGQRTGILGDVACFSFYPGKNLGAYGDGGAVAGNNETLLKKVKMLANHGRLEKYLHEIEGVNSRLDGLQAAILRVKLPHLDKWNEARQQHAAQYLSLLRGGDMVLPSIHPDADPVWHLFVVRLADREKVQAKLKQQGIDTGVHYPVPLHLQPAYAYLKLPKGSLPITEKVSAQILSLPMYAEMTEEMVSTVVNALR